MHVFPFLKGEFVLPSIPYDEKEGQKSMDLVFERGNWVFRCGCGPLAWAGPVGDALDQSFFSHVSRKVAPGTDILG